MSGMNQLGRRDFVNSLCSHSYCDCDHNCWVKSDTFTGGTALQSLKKRNVLVTLNSPFLWARGQWLGSAKWLE